MEEQIDDDSPVLSKELADIFFDKNEVDLRELLYSIHIFHEASVMGEFLTCHPYIELCGDGSGNVMNPKDNTCIFRFVSLKQFVEEARRLFKKYDMKWGE